MTDSSDLTAKQQQIYQALKDKLDSRLVEMAKLLDVDQVGDLFGNKEIELRQLLQQMGQQALETAVEDPKKRGT